jgi:hypothetical protein
MGCCSPFNAVPGSTVADLSRHVNYTNGMILGADDYTQEFAYHAARDQWITRDALGYGTLSGLAVDVEADGKKGPRIRVSPGSAAAPSGKLICVGREQCGSLNAWLADPDTAAKVQKRAAGLTPPDAVELTLYLTLCYTDCAVAPVPIAGEPCRSAEELMRPSRIADDYTLNFSFTPPPMAEVEALALLDGFIAGIADDAVGGTDAKALALLTARASLQLRLALGANDRVADPVIDPADLAPISVNPALRPALLLAIRQLWVTRLRPLVAAQPCGTSGIAANDCLLLAVLTVPVVNGGSVWEVKAGATDDELLVTKDESRRPLLLAGNAAARAAAAAFSAADPRPSFAFLTTSGDSPLDQGLVLIRSEAAADVKLAAATAATADHQLELRNLGKGTAKLTAKGTTKISGNANVELAPGGRITLRSDGSRDWRIIASLEGRS